MPELICSGVSKMNGLGETCELLGTVVKFMPALGGMLRVSSGRSSRVEVTTSQCSGGCGYKGGC